MISPVKPAVDALYALAVESVNGPTVLRGQGVSDAAGNMLWIGWDAFTPEQAKFDINWGESGANYGAMQEVDGDVHCSLMAWGETVEAAETAADTILTNFGQAIRSNPKLGLSWVVWSALGSITTHTDQPKKFGPVCHVSFSIHINGQI